MTGKSKPNSSRRHARRPENFIESIHHSRELFFARGHRARAFQIAERSRL
jgi:hypothetical protein